MNDTTAFLRLTAWLSPVFPTGGFNYSHGLEQAVAEGLVRDRQSLESWIGSIVAEGSGWNDAVLMAQSWRLAAAGEWAALGELAVLAEALAGSVERLVETRNQGAAFLEAARAWPSPVHGALSGEVALPVAVGAMAGSSGIELETVLAGFLQAFASNQIQSALRLMPLGQISGVAIISALEPLIRTTAVRGHAPVLTISDRPPS